MQAVFDALPTVGALCCVLMAVLLLGVAVYAIVRSVRVYRRDSARFHSVDELRRMLAEREDTG